MARDFTVNIAGTELADALDKLEADVRWLREASYYAPGVPKELNQFLRDVERGFTTHAAPVATYKAQARNA